MTHEVKIGDDVYWLEELSSPESGPTGQLTTMYGVVKSILENGDLEVNIGGEEDTVAVIKQSWLTKPPEAPPDIELDKDSETEEDPQFGPDRYYDLVKWFKNQKSYIDFEGMADTTGIVEKAEKAALIIDNDKASERYKIIKTMLVHYIFASRDTAGIDPEDDMLVEMAAMLEMFLTVRWVMKEDAK